MQLRVSAIGEILPARYLSVNCACSWRWPVTCSMPVGVARPANHVPLHLPINKWSMFVKAVLMFSGSLTPAKWYLSNVLISKPVQLFYNVLSILNLFPQTIESTLAYMFIFLECPSTLLINCQRPMSMQLRSNVHFFAESIRTVCL